MKPPLGYFALYKKPIKMKKILSIVICAIFLTGSALAQVTTAYLSGVVTNGNAGVENATIKAVLTTQRCLHR